jgi:hypothetical protein
VGIAPRSAALASVAPNDDPVALSQQLDAAYLWLAGTHLAAASNSLDLASALHGRSHLEKSQCPVADGVQQVAVRLVSSALSIVHNNPRVEEYGGTERSKRPSSTRAVPAMGVPLSRSRRLDPADTARPDLLAFAPERRPVNGAGSFPHAASRMPRSINVEAGAGKTGGATSIRPSAGRSRRSTPRLR